MEDLISRSALIEKIESTDWYHISKNGNLATGANSELHTPLFKADDIFTALENAPAVDAGPKWISVKDKLPETESRCLVVRYDGVTKTSFIDILWFDKGTWWNRIFGGEYAVTHWMPLPEPPKEG